MEHDLSDCQHVRPEMRQFLAVEGRERLKQCWESIFIQTPYSKEAFKALKARAEAPPSTKPRGLVITGEADSGKSRTLKQFCDENPSSIDEESEYARFPALYMLAPDQPNRVVIYKDILSQIGQPLLYAAKEVDLRMHAITMMRNCKVGTIMIDELHDITRQRLMTDQAHEFMKFIKGLANATGRPFVVGGVPVILEIVASDRQIETRFDDVITMNALTLKEFAIAALAFEKKLPLRKPSKFKEDDSIIRALYTESNGYIGRLSYLLHDACEIAIESGEEQITLDILRKVQNRSIRAVTKRDD